MNRFALVLLVALTPLALSADDKKPAPFASKDGKFSVALPDKPTEKTSKVKVGDAEATLHIFSVDQKEPKRGYVITYIEYPKGTVGADKDKFVAGVVERNVARLKGKVASNEPITLGKQKHPGRDVRVELAETKQLYRARVFLVGERVYQVTVLGAEEAVKGKEVDDYLASFKVDE